MFWIGFGVGVGVTLTVLGVVLFIWAVRVGGQVEKIISSASKSVTETDGDLD